MFTAEVLWIKLCFWISKRQQCVGGVEAVNMADPIPFHVQFKVLAVTGYQAQHHLRPGSLEGHLLHDEAA